MKQLAMLLLAALAGNAAYSASECVDWQAQHPDWLWCDDFESTSNLAAKYEDVSTTGFAVADGDGLDGSRGLTQKYTSGQVNAGWIVKYKPEGFPDHVFYRYYHKFGPGYTRYPPKMSRIGYRDHSTWNAIFRVHTWLTESGVLTTDTQSVNSTQGGSAGWLPLLKSDYSFASHPNEWVAVEVEVKLNTPGQRDGLFRTWINDELVMERLNVDLRGATLDKINEVMLDTYWNGGSTGNLSRSYDNFVISTKRIRTVSSQVRPKPPTDVRAN